MFVLNFLTDLVGDKIPPVPAMPDVPQVDLSQPTWDLFIYMFFGVAIILFGFTLGRQRIISILLSIYLSLVVVDYFPYVNNIWGDTDINVGFFTFKISSFAVIFILAFIILSRSEILYEMGRGGRGVLSSFVFAFLLVGLLTSIVLSYLPVSSLGFMTDFTRNLFASDVAKFVWVTAPIVGMAVLKGKED